MDNIEEIKHYTKLFLITFFVFFFIRYYLSRMLIKQSVCLNDALFTSLCYGIANVTVKFALTNT
jgi:hypothetical protein